MFLPFRPGWFLDNVLDSAIFRGTFPTQAVTLLRPAAWEVVEEVITGWQVRGEENPEWVAGFHTYLGACLAYVRYRNWVPDEEWDGLQPGQAAGVMGEFLVYSRWVNESLDILYPPNMAKVDYLFALIGVLWADPVFQILANRGALEDREEGDHVDDWDAPPIAVPRYQPRAVRMRVDENGDLIEGPPIKCTWGADPEFFVTDSTGAVVPAVTVTNKGKGSKDFLAEGVSWGIHYDNVMLELDTGDPRSIKDMIVHLPAMLKHIDIRVQGKGLVLNPCPVMKITPEIAREPTATEMGCDPDFSIYNKDIDKPNLPFKLEEIGLDRFAGGHLHFGYPEPNLERSKELIEALDVWVLPYVDFLEGTEKGRKKFYGSPGRFRPKPYGFEWRSPSNAWLKNKKTIDSFLWLANAVLQDILMGKYTTKSQGHMALVNESRISQQDPAYTDKDRKVLINRIGNILSVRMALE